MHTVLSERWGGGGTWGGSHVHLSLNGAILLDKDLAFSVAMGTLSRVAGR